MVFTQRLAIIVLLVMLLVPVVGVDALVSLDEREQIEESLMEALEEATVQYRSLPRVSPEEVQRELEEEERALQRVGREKSEVRRQLGSVRKGQEMLMRYGIDPSDTQTFEGVVEEGEKIVAELARSLAVQKEGGALWFLVKSLSKENPPFLYGKAVWDGLSRVFQELFAHRGTPEEYEKLLNRYRALSEEYMVIQGRVDVSRRYLAAEGERHRAARKILADVHEQVLNLQGSLERIDAKLRERAERELIAWDLWPSGERVAFGGGVHEAGGPLLHWPVYGSVSAGFLDSAYEEHFGIPHEGVDIAVPQGSPVFSAADGVVFFVREGGEKGYTYVLIGHRDGFATVYGHLSSVVKSMGEEVQAGELIGLSGGEVGARGSGPLTTGPHVHFEVIQHGAHVDPLGFLL